MKITFTLVLAVILLGACKKDKDIPEVVTPQPKTYPESISAGIISQNNIHHEIDPDTVLIFEYPSSDAHHSLDINSDGVEDLKISLVANASAGSQYYDNSVTPFPGCEILTVEGNAAVVDTLVSGSVIDSSSNFTNQSAKLRYYYFLTLNETQTSGIWNIEDRENFMGVKITNTSGVYYGWVRMKLSSLAHLTIMDYGCTLEY